MIYDFSTTLVHRTNIYSTGGGEEERRIWRGRKRPPLLSRAATLLRRGTTKLSRISDWRIASKTAGRVNNRYVFASHETSRGMSAFRLRFDDRENRPGWTKRRDVRKKRIVEQPFFGYGITNLCVFLFFPFSFWRIYPSFVDAIIIQNLRI